jgi:hypothetical protein
MLKYTNNSNVTLTQCNVHKQMIPRKWHIYNRFELITFITYIQSIGCIYIFPSILKCELMDYCFSELEL